MTELLPYDWTWTSHETMEISAWCLNRNSESVLLRIVDYTPFISIELPRVVNKKQYKWNQASVDHFYNHLCRVLQDDRPLPGKILQAKSKLYYYSSVKYPVLTIKFKNMDHARHCVNLLAKPVTIRGTGVFVCHVWEDRV